MDFAATVKTARNKLKMSQENLARALNVSYATVNRWENGKTHPNKMAKQVFMAFCEQNGIYMPDFKEGYIQESSPDIKGSSRDGGRDKQPDRGGRNE